jgi:hypothetical protein
VTSEQGSKTDLLKNADCQHFQHFQGKSAFLRGLATAQSKTTTFNRKLFFDVFDLKASVPVPHFDAWFDSVLGCMVR